MFAIIAVAIIALIALFFILPTVRYQLIGIGLIFGAIYAVINIQDTKSRMFVFATLGIIGLSLIIFSGSLPGISLGSTVLSISNVQITQGSTTSPKVVVTAVAGTGADSLMIDWSTSELNSQLSGTGFKATESVTGLIELTKELKKFQIMTPDPNKNFVQYTYKNLGIATVNGCKANIPSGYTYYGYKWTGLTNMACIYYKSYGLQSSLNSAGIEDSEVRITIEGASGTLHPSQGTNSITLNDGKTKVQYVGSLNNYNQIYPPSAFAVLYEGSQYSKMIDYDSYARFESSFNTFKNCIGSQGTPTALTDSDDWKSAATVAKCITEHNNRANALLVDKKSEYLNSLNGNADSVTLSGNYIVVDMQAATSLPLIVLTLDAKSVGIIKLSGKPDITTCVPDVTLDSGISLTKSLTVKNVGTQSGSFSGQISCTNNVIATISEKYISAGSSANMPVTINGINTNANAPLSSTCQVTITDLNSGEKDTCSFGVSVNYKPNIICTPSQTSCQSGTILRTCNSAGTNYIDTTCSKTCVVSQTGIASCSGEQQCDPGYYLKDGNCIKQLECEWYQEKTPDKDYGFLYWRAIVSGIPILKNMYPPLEKDVCKTKDWVYIVTIAGIITIIGVAWVLVNKKPSKSNRRRK